MNSWITGKVNYEWGDRKGQWSENENKLISKSRGHWKKQQIHKSDWQSRSIKRQATDLVARAHYNQ